MDTISETSSWTVPRVLAALVALVPTPYALLELCNQIQQGFDPLGAGFGSGAATVAAICWWFALRGHRRESRVRMRYALWGGFILGGISFAAGFIGPMVLTPESNQGPLLGILITGPIGSFLGVVIGALYGLFRSRSNSS